MLRKKIERVEWLEFELLAGIPELKHAVFLKSGENISNEKELLSQILGCPTLVAGNQKHGINTVEVPCVSEALLQDCDGLMTSTQGVGLMIRHADCQAAIIYDPIRKVVANVHVGWRGNVQNMYKEAILQMQKRYRSSPQDLLVCISPSLGPCCAEFKNYRLEFPSSFVTFQEKENHFNLWHLAQAQLQECGILSHHIEIAEVCTKCSSDCYSYRRKEVGRHATVVLLN